MKALFLTFTSVVTYHSKDPAGLDTSETISNLFLLCLHLRNTNPLFASWNPLFWQAVKAFSKNPVLFFAATLLLVSFCHTCFRSLACIILPARRW
jgi:hypothetical protein